jgi:hypothetical protein
MSCCHLRIISNPSPSRWQFVSSFIRHSTQSHRSSASFWAPYERPYNAGPKDYISATPLYVILGLPKYSITHALAPNYLRQEQDMQASHHFSPEELLVVARQRSRPGLDLLSKLRQEACSLEHFRNCGCRLSLQVSDRAVKIKGSAWLQWTKK